MRHRRLLLGAAAVAVVGAAGVAMARDAAALESTLRRAERALTTAQDALLDGDTGAASDAVALADTAVADAERRTDGPAWALARLVPHYGASARAATGGVTLADATVQLAGAAVRDAAALVEQGAAAFTSDDGRIDASALADAADVLAGLPLGPVRQARDDLARLPTSGLVGPAREARVAAVEQADRVISQLERAHTGAATFASFLAADEPRTYLLAVQNNAELRGTGGLISYLAEVDVDAGRLDVRPTGDQAAVDEGESRAYATFPFITDDPVERPDDFAARYDEQAAGSLVQNVNLDPDLPTVGPVLLRLYEARTGRRVDGAILVDAFALAAIIEGTGGPLELPLDLLEEAPGLAREVSAEVAPRTMLIDVYDAFGGENPARRQFDDAVTLGVLSRLTRGDWDPATLAGALADAAADRRLQLYSTDEDEQAGFLALGIAGAMPTPSDGSDVLAITGVNAGPDKSDAHVAHLLTADLTLRAEPGEDHGQVSRSGVVTVEVVNPLRPFDHDEYITGTNEPVPVGGGPSPRTRDALNRTWFTIWTPASARLTALRDGINGGSLDTSTIHGHTAIDHYLETPSASTAAFSAPYDGPVALREVDGRLLYELRLWRQAKPVADTWDVTVHPPDGFTVDEVTAIGGGAPATGLGPVEPMPLVATVVDGDDARVRGTVTRDVTIRVWLRPA